jgi:histidinol phosphatase-like PHP family hydrolase
VLCSIIPDAHSTAQLQYLHCSILQARKGRLHKQDVVNTFSLEKITDYLAK